MYVGKHLDHPGVFEQNKMHVFSYAEYSQRKARKSWERITYQMWIIFENEQNYFLIETFLPS